MTEATPYKKNYWPVVAPVALLALMLALFFILKASWDVDGSQEGALLLDYFPMIALVLAGVSTVLGLLYVQRERQRTHRTLNALDRRNQALSQYITDLSEDRQPDDTPEGDESLLVAVRLLHARMLGLAAEQNERKWSLEGMAFFSDILRRHHDLDALSREFIRQLAQYVGAAQGAIFIIRQDDAESLRISGAYVSDDMPQLTQDLLRGEGLVGQVIQEAKPLYLEQAPAGYVRIASGLGEAPSAHLLLTPMVVENRVEGVIELASFKAIGERERAFVTELANKVGVTVFNLKTAARTGEMLQEARGLTDALQAGEAAMRIRDRAIASSSAAAVITAGSQPQQPIIYVNPAFESITGYAAGEVMGRPLDFIFEAVAEQAAVEELRRAQLEGVECRVLLQAVRKDGAIFWNELSLSPVFGDDGRRTHFVWLFNDVTQRIEIENQVRRMNENFEAMVRERTESLSVTLEESQAQEEEVRQNAEEMAATKEEMARLNIELSGQIGALNNSAIVSEANIAGDIVMVNDQFVLISKYNRDELIGRNHRLLKSGHQPDELFIDLWCTISAGIVWKGAIKNRAKDGSYYWVATTVTPILGADGKPTKYVGVRFDITDQKAQEERIAQALEESQTQKEEIRRNAEEKAATQDEITRINLELKGQIAAMNNAALVSEADLVGNIIYVNDTFCRVAKYDREELIGRNHRMLKSGHQSDDIFVDLWHTISAGRVWRGLIKNKAKDGTYYWVQSTVTPILGLDGKPYKYVGVRFEVTERIEIENQVRRMNENLEEMVRERTESLSVTLDELRSTQTRVVQSEKMASLGQLVAGVAHEINTPLAAIKAAAENMTEYLPRAIDELPNLMGSLEAQHRLLFLELVHATMTANDQLTTRDERRLRKEFEELLLQAGVADAREVAKKLVANGLREDVLHYLPLLLMENSKEAMQTAYYIGQMRTNLDVIHQAANKTHKTVYALKRYTHFQQEAMAEDVDLRDNLEVILTVYHNQLKHGVEVVRHYEDNVPSILGYSDELGQVWTNIIHNAAQAMQFQGRLEVGLRRAGDNVVVMLADNGPGIPEAVLPRIFEPFFTTKPKGEGTGLGLDICRKIIEKHEGHVAATSRPGQTCFTITLPIESSTLMKQRQEREVEFDASA